MQSIAHRMAESDETELFNGPESWESYNVVLVKWYFIVQNRTRILDDVEETLSGLDLSQKDWVEPGRALLELFERSRLDVVMDASYFYLKTHFGSILEFTQAIARRVVEYLEANSWILFEEDVGANIDLDNEGYENGLTYREDLAVVARFIGRRVCISESYRLRERLKHYRGKCFRAT